MTMATLHLTALVVVVVSSIGWFLYTTWAQRALEQSRKAFKERHGCEDPPPGIRRWDISGFYGLYMILKAAKEHRLLEYWNDNYKLYGATHGGKRRGGSSFITTMDQENFKAIHATNFEDWTAEETRSGFHSVLGRGVFTTDGAFWAHSRAVLRPQFEKHQVSDIAQFEPHVQRLFANIPIDGSTVDLQDLFHKFSMDTSSEFLSGKSTALLDKAFNREGHEFAAAFEAATHDGILRCRLGWIYWLMPHSGSKKAIRVVRQYADRWVDEATRVKQASIGEKSKDKKGHYVFLNELATDERMHPDRIRDEMLNIMLAGRDTTASLLSDLFFVLAREPAIFKKLQTEIDELNGGLPTYEALREMKYLKFCVQETLRLYPPVPALVKVAARDTVLPRGGGPDGQSPLFMAKGDFVFYNHRSMMRSESIYGPDSTTYRPERWANSALRPGWAFLPFGGGARTCLGQQYALNEAYYVVIRLLQEYRRIESRDDQPWREKLSATLCSLNGTKVAMCRQ